jgi:hypothetical protein
MLRRWPRLALAVPETERPGLRAIASLPVVAQAQ